MKLYFQPSLISGSDFLKHLKNNDWLKLVQGIIIHSSQFEITEGKKYQFENLPTHGEWLILSDCCIICGKNSDFIIENNQNIVQANSNSLEQHHNIISQREIVNKSQHIETSVKYNCNNTFKGNSKYQNCDESVQFKRDATPGLSTQGLPSPFRKVMNVADNRISQSYSRNKWNFLNIGESAWQIITTNSKLPNFIKIYYFFQKKVFNYPFYKQHSNSDCGAACLKMISRYWGKDIDYKTIVDQANIDRSGASLQNLMDAGEAIGFNIIAGKSDLLGLETNILPAIAHWQANHYVVVYKISKNKIIISDPKIGQRTISRDNFLANWTGYGLWLNPTTKFYNQRSKQSLLKFLTFLRPYRIIFLEIFIASIVINIIGLITPVFTQILLDEVISSNAILTFWAIGSGLYIIRTSQIILISIRKYLLFHTANRLDLNLITNFINHALKLPISYFESRYVGDIISRISENRKIRQFITTDAITTILDLISIFVYTSLMFWYSWTLSFLALSIVPILLLITLLSTFKLMSLSREVFNEGTKEQSYLIEIFSGISTIKSMGIEQSIRWNWENLLNKYIKLYFSNQITVEKLSLISSLSETIISISVLLLSIWQVIHNQLTIGQLIAFNMLVGQVIDPVKRLNLLWHNFQEIRISIERCSDVIESTPETGISGSNLIDIKSFKGHIIFNQVYFKYSNKSINNIIDNISFEIKPGQTVALVGRSGSGKTTLSKLILGLYQPQQGEILIDNQNIKNISLRSLRNQVGIVDQNTFFFGGTIQENLLIANPNATMKEIESACQLACAASFIDNFPLKYNTKIGEGGGLLSGGQKQRLAIARAILRSPSLLILDEATSSLDTESENLIQKNLRSILANQTTLIIAHRLSTIKNADLILVLDNGKLVESGTHAQLINNGKIYHHLVSQQSNLHT
ncbi:cyclic nucleotide-regulated ABC bacteriocin/lantibiotic exporter (plasmid) [Chondrocystis sp. NIES-4102]|nr:cyclic nucleotide-regulated ABC bacteriocin/lantibiotic exporter [Chondrocystis sp. NIES-4102]